MTERKLGEIFKYGNVMLKVKRVSGHSCVGCYFFPERHFGRQISKTGYCVKRYRTDKTNVIFVEVEHKTEEK